MHASTKKPIKAIVICITGPTTNNIHNQNKWTPQQWENKAHVLKTTIHNQFREKEISSNKISIR